MAKPKAHSYIRFSTRDQRKSSSLHRQLKHTRDFALRHGLELQEQTYEPLYYCRELHVEKHTTDFDIEIGKGMGG